MPYSVETLYTGNGVSTQFGIDFEYQSADHVYVSVNSVVVPTVFFAPSTILIAPAPAAGAAIRIWRETPIDVLNHVFQLGAPFRPTYIDANNEQLLFASQESRAIADAAGDTANGVSAIAQSALDKAQLALDTAQSAGVASFNGRTGVVESQSGDYTAAQITRGMSNVDAALSALESGKQPVDATLTALAAVNITSGDKLIYAVGVDDFSTTNLTSFARTLLDDINATAARSTLGLNTAATAVLTTSNADQTAGRVPKNGDKQLCSAWVNFNGAGTVAIRDSFNVSSITDGGTGVYDVNFASPMANTYYTFACGLNDSADNLPVYKTSATVPPTTSSLRLITTNNSGGARDFSLVSVQFFGGK